MATTVWPSQGTTLAIDEVIGNTNTFSLINNITSLEGLGGGTVTQAKTSALSSLVHTYRGTIKDPAEISADLWYDPTDAVHKFIRNANDNPTNGVYTWQASFNTGNTNSSATFLGNMSSFDGPTAGDVEDNLTASITVKITGATTWNAAT
jgi:hypothetical protein